jgi:hypothetical protein
MLRKGTVNLESDAMVSKATLSDHRASGSRKVGIMHVTLGTKSV